MKPEAFIAVDFGAGSGRVIAGTIEGGILTMEEVHRFGNRQVTLLHRTYWDFPCLYADMTEGLRKAAAAYRIRSIGIDTWGVDFGLIDKHGNLLGNPISYRSEETAGSAAEFFAAHPDERLHYSEAGIQIMDINSIFRLDKMGRTDSEMLGCADKLLFMPDLFSYYLTGNANIEYTIATTSGLIDARTGGWNRRLIAEAGLPERLFGKIVQPGEVRGRLTEAVKRSIGVDYDVEVVATGSHDTASAVYATGRTYGEHRTAFLSSGTWSLLGAAIDKPVLNEEARQGGFTNEGGVGGCITFLQNITGLWILQCLMKEWENMGCGTDYETLIQEAENASIDSTIDVDDKRFHAPASMAKAIADYCREKGAKEPESRGECARVVLQSLALRYSRGIAALNALLPYPVERLQIIGGGSRNRLLNRLTGEATGLEIVAGPVEATAIGNIMTQAMGAKAITSVSDIKKIKEQTK